MLPSAAVTGFATKPYGWSFRQFFRSSTRRALASAIHSTLALVAVDQETRGSRRLESSRGMQPLLDGARVSNRQLLSRTRTRRLRDADLSEKSCAIINA